MKIETTYKPDEKIFYKKYKGKISVEDVISSWKKNIENFEIPEETNGFILDYTEAEMDFGFDKYNRIPQFYGSNLATFGSKPIAIVVTTPENTVFPYLISLEDSGYRSCPFSSVAAARRWILG
jgi:hypothetical protein